MFNAGQNAKVFNSLDEIHSDDKGYVKNAEHAFKDKVCSFTEQGEVYNVSNKFSNVQEIDSATTSDNCLSSNQQPKKNRLTNLNSSETILRGTNLNRIKVYNTSRLVI